MHTISGPRVGGDAAADAVSALRLGEIAERRGVDRSVVGRQVGRFDGPALLTTRKSS